VGLWEFFLLKKKKKKDTGRAAAFIGISFGVLIHRGRRVLLELPVC